MCNSLQKRALPHRGKNMIMAHKAEFCPDTLLTSRRCTAQAEYEHELLTHSLLMERSLKDSRKAAARQLTAISTLFDVCRIHTCEVLLSRIRRCKTNMFSRPRA